MSGRQARRAQEKYTPRPAQGGSNPCDWPEDFAHENGNYQNACLSCGRTFIGHKRRYACRQCVATTLDGRRGVPAYHPTEAQPARCGGTET